MSDRDPVVFDEQSARLISQAVKAELARIRNPRPIATIVEPQRQDPIQWMPFFNDASETAPAFAIMQVTTGILYSSAADSWIMRCTKPTTVFTRWYVFNGALEVPAGQSGFCTFEGPCRALCATTTIAYGEGWGPKANQWTLQKGYPGTSILGTIDGENKEVLVQPEIPISKLLIKAVSTVAAAALSTGTNVDIIGGTLGGETDIGVKAPDFYNPGAAFSTGNKGVLEWINNGWIGGKIC